MTKNKKITGYKMFKVDTDGKWYCDGGDERFYYEIGKTYKTDEALKCCSSGFHFCKKLKDCFRYHECVTWNKIALVEAVGEIDESEDDSKCATNKIKILEEIPFNEIAQIRSYGVSYSKGVNGSDGVSHSNGVSYSNGVSCSDGVSYSNGVNGSDGVNRSYGVLKCYGVDNALFLANKPRTFSIFGKEVTEERFNEVYDRLQRALNGWTPTFNNLRGLYRKFGNDWKLVPIPEAAEISKEEAWRDMPKEAIEYVASLPEFDAAMFKEITGIEAGND